MHIQPFIGGYDDNFTYVVHGDREALIIDPSVPSKEILSYIEENNLTIKAVIVMHSHFDHLVDLNIYKRLGFPLYAHENSPVPIDKQLKDNDHVTIEDSFFTVLFTPGHVFDAICLYGEKVLFTSDTVFVHKTGRIDLPGSDAKDMWESIQTLKKLPDETIIYPGHDYSEKQTSTIGEEKEKSTLFLMDKEEFFSKFVR